MRSTILLLLGAAGAVTAVAPNVPQARLSVLRGEIGGLSPVAWWMNVAASITCIVYALGLHDTAQLGTNLALLVLQAAILFRIVTLGADGRRTSRPGAAGLALWVGLVLAVPAHAGTLLLLVAFAGMVPEVRYLARADDLRGISRAGCYLGLSSSVIWLAYGVLTGMPAVLLPSAVRVVKGAYVLWLLRRPADADVIDLRPHAHPAAAAIDDVALAATA